MIRELVLKIFLALPILNQLTEIAIAILVKRQTLKFSLTNFKSGFKRKLDESKLASENSQKYHWIIQISAPSGNQSKSWGDTYFAQEIANSLKKLNQEAVIVYRDQDPTKLIKPNSVMLNIRGLLPLVVSPTAINVLWVISHPTQITKREIKKYELAFAASESWALKRSKQWKLRIQPLLQATNGEIFNTKFGEFASIDRLLFVGNTRGIFRKSVKVASSTVSNLSVIGRGWEKYLKDKQILSEFIDNNQLSAEYRKSKYVLNDHWSDMAKNGFISNRLFDAVASGARVISDFVQGSKEIFGSSLVEYKDNEDLGQILRSDLIKKFGSQTEIDKNALIIQNQHNFDQRAKQLFDSVNEFILKRL